mmetsp:Transcript_6017/g.18136  ORF Transcript_6017/g.18136 Transcript_6017/m.18136 type:complete len:303 (-) Transcript_6017:147-1055(-)|eukprot:CAMPEP_0198725524 /NCGR_PEP_ID=MMETSP1475-20131203/2817_1 /TAXON_ID= ORGANISM="Unidentified sp., Strain CCMP1999" /NCGR_SAMPLE_ID=MMETSP1475 /ASSEMBLY_ACC=CAM_ASM_001111 /LENGTH=302 /DNA_ID=CAMNT_0044487319 /DNA_START=46 /DNA_END=954 /DNA_ORIENTATION=-
MASLIATPYLVVNLGCDYLFLLESRLRSEAAIPAKKTDEVLVDCAFALFEENVIEKSFKRQKLQSVEEVKRLFYIVGQSPSLRIDEANLDKLFTIIGMAMKAQLMRMRTADDAIVFAEKHLNEVRLLLDRTSLGEEAYEVIDDVRKRLLEWYKDMTLAEFHRMRITLLNYFADLRTPVSALIEASIQHDTGYLFAPTRGENIENLGNCIMFSEDGEVEEEVNLAVAGKTISDKLTETKINLFSSLRSNQDRKSNNALEAVASKPFRSPPTKSMVQTSPAKNRTKNSEDEDAKLQDLLDSFNN